MNSRGFLPYAPKFSLDANKSKKHINMGDNCRTKR